MKQENDAFGFTKKLLTYSEQKYCDDFDCGNEYINNFVRNKAVDDVDSTTFLYVDNNTGKVVCAYTLSCSGIVAELNEKIYIHPAVEIRIFALSNEYQHKRYDEYNTYGDIFLADVISSIDYFTENYCGASRIVLYAVPQYKTFYERNSFKTFCDFMKQDESSYNEDCIPMFYNF